MASPIDLGTMNIQNTDRIGPVSITKDGAVWGAAVVVGTFFPPDGSGLSSFTRNFTLLSAGAGTYYYDTVIGDFLAPGKWRLSLTATEGAVVKTYPYAIFFRTANQGS